MKNKLEIERATLGKASMLFIIIVILAFASGLYMGRQKSETSSLYDSDSAFKEQLSACSYKMQEITTKYTTLKKLAKSKNLLDSDGNINSSWSCTVCDEKIEVAEKTVEKKKAVKKPLKSPRQKVAKLKKVPAVKKSKLHKKAEKSDNVWAEIDRLKKKKKKEAVKAQKKLKKTCKYSLQIFAGRNKAEAENAKKHYKLKGTRLVKATINNVTWYRIRYECYSSKIDAEKDLKKIKSKVKGAIVVNN